MPRGHNCRGHELVGQDGKLYVRADGFSVLFKRLPDAELSRRSDGRP